MYCKNRNKKEQLPISCEYDKAQIVGFNRSLSFPNKRPYSLVSLISSTEDVRSTAASGFSYKVARRDARWTAHLKDELRGVTL